MVSITRRHLIHLDHHLRRIRRDDQHIRVGLHKQASVFLVGLAQALARLHRLSKAGIKIGSLGNTAAVRAFPAEVRETVSLSRLQAIQSLCQHQRQRVLA